MAEFNEIRKKLFVVILSAVIVSNAIPVFSVADGKKANKKRIVVSMGDSYSSGEGIEDFYGYDKAVSERVKDTDWLAHRSKNAWPGLLKLKELPGNSQFRDYKVNNNIANYKEDSEMDWYFIASSGAETKHILNERQEKKYHQGSYEGTEKLPKQIDILRDMKSQGDVPDYVTLTIGGNDAGFANIITESIVCGEGYGSANILRKQFALTWTKFYIKGGIRDNIKKVYKEIEKQTSKETTIIVAGYPRLLSPLGHIGEFSLEECQIINENVSSFNNAIKGIVNECQNEGMNIVFVSVEDAFDGHGAYSKDEYLNGVVYTPQAQDLHDKFTKGGVSAYSMHPNKKGAQAYAACVQKVINEREGWKATIPTEPTPSAKTPKETSLTTLTADQIEKAFANYLEINHPDIAKYIKSGEYNCGFWIGDIENGKTTVLLRSYTGSYSCYYIDVVSGETYVTEYFPAMNIEEHETGERFNIRDYLNRTTSSSDPFPRHTLTEPTTFPKHTLPETTPLSPTQGSTMNPESQSAKQIAYAAYLKVLQNNKKAIKAYKKMNVFDSMKKEDGWLGGYWFGDKPLIQKSSNKNCALCELTGDTIPELLFVTSKKNKVKFHVYTYNSSKGKAVEILSLNLSTYEPNRYLGYALYRTKDNRLVFFSDYGLGNGDSGNNADVYKYNGKKMKVVDSYRAVGTAPTYFKINKKNTSYKNFESKKKKLVNSTEQVIFYTVIWDSVSGQVTLSKKLKSVSMSYEGCEKILKG